MEGMADKAFLIGRDHRRTIILELLELRSPSSECAGVMDWGIEYVELI